MGLVAEYFTKLRPLVERFGKFYIRYDVETLDDGTPSYLDADVYEVAEWMPDGTPIFFHYDGPAVFSKGPITDPTHHAVKPLCTLGCKWDGCSVLRMPQLEYAGLDEFEAFAAMVRFIEDELCSRHRVGDYPA